MRYEFWDSSALEGTLKLQETKLGLDHPNTLMTRNNLAQNYRAVGRISEAFALYETTLRAREAKLGPDHPDTLRSRNNLAAAYFVAGRVDQAVPILEATYRKMEMILGLDHSDTSECRGNLAVVYQSLGRLADAEHLWRKNLASRRKVEKHSSPMLAGDLSGIGSSLLKQAKWLEAESLLRESLAIREKVVPDDWSRFNTMSQIGGALLGQGRYAEAEPLVIGGYEGMKARATKIPPTGKPRLPEAAERVIQLYEDWGKPEKLIAWKVKFGLAELPVSVFACP